MDAYQSQIVDIAYSDEPPILLVGSSDDATRMARRAIEASRYRIGASLPIELARERITTQPKASAVWIEIDRHDGPLLDDLLGQVVRDVDAGRYGAVVSTTRSFIDPLFAFLENSPVELIADADGTERITALATVAAQRETACEIAEANSDRNSERLRQRGDEPDRFDIGPAVVGARRHSSDP